MSGQSLFCPLRSRTVIFSNPLSTGLSELHCSNGHSTGIGWPYPISRWTSHTSQCSFVDLQHFSLYDSCSVLMIHVILDTQLISKIQTRKLFRLAFSVQSISLAVVFMAFYDSMNPRPWQRVNVNEQYADRLVLSSSFDMFWQSD